MRGSLVAFAVLVPSLAHAEPTRYVDVDATVGFGNGIGIALASVIGGFHVGGPLWFRVGGGVGIALAGDGGGFVLGGRLGAAVRNCAHERQMCIESGVDVGALTLLGGNATVPEVIPRVAGIFGGRRTSFRIQIAVDNLFDSTRSTFYPVMEASLGVGYAW